MLALEIIISFEIKNHKEQKYNFFKLKSIKIKPIIK